MRKIIRVILTPFSWILMGLGLLFFGIGMGAFYLTEKMMDY